MAEKYIEEQLKELENMLKNPQGIENLNMLLDIERQLRRLTDRFLSILEHAVDVYGFNLRKDQTGTKKYYDLRKLLYRLKAKYASQLMEDIGRKGYKLRKELGDIFEASAYKILELTRKGNRSEVFYTISRIFIANGKDMPVELQEAFKLYYDLQTFQCFIYTFLVSVLKKEDSSEEEVSHDE